MSTHQQQVPSRPASLQSPIEKALPVLVVPLLPFLVLLGDRSLLFNHPGQLDPWFYYGMFRNLAAIKTLFPGTYYASRLSLILPGYVVHQLFAPVLANYVFHLMVWLAAASGLYVVIRHVTGRRAALITTVAFGYFPYLWRAVGWDYPDGIGNAYYLLTMAFLTLAARDQIVSRRYLFLAGITCAGALYCNLTWAFLLPTFGPYWIFLRKARGYSLALARALSYSAAGFVFLSVVLGLVNHQLNGLYLFYWPSISYAIGGVQTPSPYGAKGVAWLLTLPWLYLTMAAVLAGMASLIRFRWRRGDFHARMVVALYVNLLLCVGVLTAWEILGQPLLQISYYASYLLASTFLFLGVNVFSVTEKFRTRTFCLFLAAAIAVCSWVWWDPTGTTWRWMIRSGWGPVVVVGIAAVVAGGAFAGRMWAVSLAVVGIGLLSLNARSSTTALWWSGHSAAQTEEAFERIAESIDIGTAAARPVNILRFWYDGSDQNVQEFSSINSSYLYGYTKVPTDYPKPPDQPAEGLTAILSSLSDHEREAALAQAKRGLKAHKVDMEVLSDHVIERGGVRYGMTIVRQMHEPIPVGTKELFNDDFEYGTAGWSGGWAKTRVVDGGQSGKALELVPEQGSTQYVMQWNCVRLEPGKKYRLVVWTKSGTSGDEPFVVGVYDGTSSGFVGAAYGKTAKEWRPQEVVFTNDSANLLSVELMKNSPSTGTMLFDSVTLTEAP